MAREGNSMIRRFRTTPLLLGLIVLAAMPSVVSANCISPLLTPTECDFKNEDTNLWLYQPPLKWTSEEKIRESISSADQFASVYLNSIKVTGDAAIRYLHDGKAAAQEAAMVFQGVRATAAAANNDPWNLKTLYTDVICDAWWSAVEAASGTRTGDCRFDWVAAGQQLLESREATQRIRDIITNPNLLLGEQWGDVVDDMNRVRAEYNELETMASNLGAVDMEQELAAKFKTFEQMLINPVSQPRHRNVVKPLIDLSLENTVRDILMANQADAKNLLGAAVVDPADLAVYQSDLAEIQNLSGMNDLAIGRMQATELGNMSKSLEGQAWQEITEQYRSMGYMMGLDMQSEIEDESHGRSLWYRYTEELQTPMNELNPNDGVPLGF